MSKKLISFTFAVVCTVSANAMHSPLTVKLLKFRTGPIPEQVKNDTFTSPIVANSDWQKKILTCMQDCIRVYYFWHKNEHSHLSYQLVQKLGNFANKDYKKPMFQDGPILSLNDLRKLNGRVKQYKDSEPYISSNETKKSVENSHHKALGKSCSEIKEIFSDFSDYLSIQIQEDYDVILQSQYETAKRILELVGNF